jgi:hypothetical protein
MDEKVRRAKYEVRKKIAAFFCTSLFVLRTSRGYQMLQGDKQFKASWPANTTPQAPDGSGAAAVTLGGYTLTNTNAAARSVKFYDKASAPTVGTDVPKRTVTVPATSTLEKTFPRGVNFLAGLWISVTVNPADTDTNAPGAGDLLVTVDYQS